eukprot:3241261-Rhodomonas_salina.3
MGVSGCLALCALLLTLTCARDVGSPLGGAVAPPNAVTVHQQPRGGGGGTSFDILVNSDTCLLVCGARS